MAPTAPTLLTVPTAAVGEISNSYGFKNKNFDSCGRVIVFRRSLFLFWQFFGREYFQIKKCVADLKSSTEEDLISESNIFIRRRDAADADFRRLAGDWQSYFSCRFNYDYYANPQKIRDWANELDFDASFKKSLFENLNNIYSVTPFRRNIIQASLEYLCPTGKENPGEVGKCLNYPASWEDGKKFNYEEVIFACNNFCRDLARYEENQDLFFEEQARLKTLTPYSMANFIKVSWAIRFGGWDFAFKEAEKFPAPYRDLALSRLAEGQKSLTETAEKK